MQASKYHHFKESWCIYKGIMNGNLHATLKGATQEVKKDNMSH
jgi:hypothetical protein